MINVFDFDGTIITINSFPKWIKYAILNYWKFSLFAYCKLIFYCILRRMNIINHIKFKHVLIAILDNEKFNFSFSLTLHKYFRKELIDLISYSKYDNILITAAPINYIKHFKFLNFLEIHASHVIGSKMINYAGEDKIKPLKKRTVHCSFADEASDQYILAVAKKPVLLTKRLTHYLQMRKKIPALELFEKDNP